MLNLFAIDGSPTASVAQSPSAPGISFAILVAGLANFVRLKEENLAQTFIGVDLCGQRSGVEISSVTKPSHSGSNGVTFTMMPQRA